MDSVEVRRIFEECNALLSGHFRLSSGRHSDEYWEKFWVLQWPERVQGLCGEIARRYANSRVNVVLGPTTGGILLAFEVARAIGRARALRRKRGWPRPAFSGAGSSCDEAGHAHPGGGRRDDHGGRRARMPGPGCGPSSHRHRGRRARRPERRRRRSRRTPGGPHDRDRPDVRAGKLPALRAVHPAPRAGRGPDLSGSQTGR